MVFLVAAASLVAIDTTVWLWACSRLAQGLQDYLGVAQSQGWSVHADAPVRAGWPLAAAVELPAFTLTADPAAFPGGALWTADRLRIQLPFTAPKALHVLAEGAQTLRLEGLPVLAFHAQTMHLQAALDGAAPPLLSIAALQAELPWGSMTVERGTVQFPFDAVLLDAARIGVPGGIGRALGVPVEQLRVRAALTRPIPPGPTPAAQARAWRDAGGRVDAPEISMHWGPLGVSGHAVIALDSRLQPLGDGSFAVTGAPQALDELGRAGVLPPGTVTAVKAVLTLLGAPTPGAPVQLPVQLRDGILAVARFPLLRLPQLVWGPP